MKCSFFFTAAIVLTTVFFSLQSCQKRAYCTYYSTGGAIRLYEKDFSNSQEYYQVIDGFEQQGWECHEKAASILVK